MVGLLMAPYCTEDFPLNSTANFPRGIISVSTNRVRLLSWFRRQSKYRIHPQSGRVPSDDVNNFIHHAAAAGAQRRYYWGVKFNRRWFFSLFSFISNPFRIDGGEKCRYFTFVSIAPESSLSNRWLRCWERIERKKIRVFFYFPLLSELNKKRNVYLTTPWWPRSSRLCSKAPRRLCNRSSIFRFRLLRPLLDAQKCLQLLFDETTFSA